MPMAGFAQPSKLASLDRSSPPPKSVNRWFWGDLSAIDGGPTTVRSKLLAEQITELPAATPGLEKANAAIRHHRPDR